MLREVVSALRYVIEIDGEFETFEVRPDEDGTEHCYIRIRRTLADGREPTVLLRLEVISSGYRAILALICDVLRGLIEVSYVPPGARSSDSQKAKAVREAREAKAIVLVDEIEAHMHPRWKLNIVSGLRQAFPGVTFLLTSHDPLCVRGMDPKEVLVLNRYLDAAGGMLEKVEAVQDRINTRAMTVEQLLTSRLFQLFSTDDMKMDRWFAEASGQLSQRESLTEEDEKAVVGRLQQEIGAGLPFGRSEVTSLVQEAVSEYLQLRRDSDSGTVSEARARAKSRVRAFLTGLLE